MVAVTPQELVFPVCNSYRRLDRYLNLISYRWVSDKKVDEAGWLAAQAIHTLERTEKNLRAMYVPDYSGL